MRLILWLPALLLAGCGAGPNADAVRKDVESRLAQALPRGAFTLSEFERRGSQSDAKAPGGEKRRIVYYDAKVKLERDVDFGAWDTPGAAGLVTALGAGPKGIVGIRSGGNKAGDIVDAHGTVLYKREGDGWVAVASGAYRPSEAPAYATNQPPSGPAALLDAMRKMIDAVPQGASAEHRAVIEEELAAAHVAIQSRLARASNGYAIAAGPEHGQYLRFAQALPGDTGRHTTALVTLGGGENLALLRAGKVSLALAQGDCALEAYQGSGAFRERGVHASLRALGSLYPEPVHVLVRADAPMTSLANLKGRRVAVGPQGSCSRTTALRVLQAHGLGPGDITVLDLPLSEALVGITRNQVDAAIQVIGVPADSIREAFPAVPLRLLPLADAAIASLTDAKSGLFAHTIASGTYGQAQPVSTVATAALLLVGTDVSETEVASLTRFVFDKGRDFAARGSAQGPQVSAATAQQGLTVPLHIAAAKVLEANAVATDAK